MSDDKKFSEDELNAPEWLNEEFLEKVLKVYKNVDKVQVREIIVSPGTTPGEHFASIMFKIDVSYECEGSAEGHSNFILKTLPVEEGVKMEFLKDSMAFPTEMRMYEEIIPKMEGILRAKGDMTVFAPKLIYKGNDPAPVIILEDMTPDDYRTPDDPLEMESAKVITEKLAKFHACSMVLNENETSIHIMTDTYFKPHPNKKPDYADEWMVPGLELAIYNMSKWEGCESIVEKLKECLKTFGEKLTQIFIEPTGQPYKVLNHGDFHFKNLLLKNGGRVDRDLLMIDFQFCTYGTPALDFAAMLYEIVSKDICNNYKDEILSLYFKTFVETLELLDFKGKIPTVEEFQQELDRCGLLDFSFVICYGAYHYLNWQEVNIMAAFEAKDPFGPIKIVWETNEQWKTDVVKTVREMIEKGYLD